MISIKDLYKSFNEKKVLEGVSIDFVKGETNLIIGQSGCGKSTISRCIVGLEEPDQGDIYFEKTNFKTSSFLEKATIRKKIGMLFQGAALFDSLTVEENLKLPLELHSQLSKPEMSDRVDFCLSKVHLENCKALYPSELSGGMKKRVGIARAIALNPDYLICDEPNSGLDPKTSIVIDALIKELTSEFNMTTIIVTHDMNSVIEIGDNINFIHQGKVWWQGDKKHVLISDNEELNNFIYPTKLMQQLRKNL